jgi:putative addiction module CopG family antidote
VASKTVSIALPRELSGYIDRKVKSGQYQDAADVVRDALRHMAATESAVEVQEFEQAFAGGHPRPETEEDVARIERAIKAGRKR